MVPYVATSGLRIIHPTSRRAKPRHNIWVGKWLIEFSGDAHVTNRAEATLLKHGDFRPIMLGILKRSLTSKGSSEPMVTSKTNALLALPLSPSMARPSIYRFWAIAQCSTCSVYRGSPVMFCPHSVLRQGNSA